MVYIRAFDTYVLALPFLLLGCTSAVASSERAHRFPDGCTVGASSLFAEQVPAASAPSSGTALRSLQDRLCSVMDTEAQSTPCNPRRLDIMEGGEKPYVR